MDKKRQPVKVKRIDFFCPIKKADTSISIKQATFRAKSYSCLKCGDHLTIGLDIGICPACGHTHPVTILLEY